MTSSLLACDMYVHDLGATLLLTVGLLWVKQLQSTVDDVELSCSTEIGLNTDLTQPVSVSTPNPCKQCGRRDGVGVQASFSGMSRLSWISLLKQRSGSRCALGWTLVAAPCSRCQRVQRRPHRATRKCRAVLRRDREPARTQNYISARSAGALPVVGKR